MIDEQHKSHKKSVYIIGSYYESDTRRTRAGYWHDGVWNKLATPPCTVQSMAEHIFIVGTEVYIAGCCRIGPSNKHGYWKNGVWNTLDTLNKDNEKTCSFISVAANDDVYIAGARHMGESGSLWKKHAGYWLNNIWHDLPVPSDCDFSETTGICIANENVYISGSYGDSSFRRINPCYWINGLRYDLSAIENNSYTSGIVVSGGNVYTLECGSGYWINDAWHKLPREGENISIAVSGNDVYVVGSSNKTAGYWFNDTWKTLNKPDGSDYISLNKIAIFENDVYITGRYHDIDEKSKSCYWLNGIFHSLAVPSAYVGSDATGIAFATE